jgi:hypothetical protein
VVVVNLKVKSFLRRIREKFLKIDLDGQRDVAQASTADACRGCSGFCAYQYPLVDGLECHVKVDRFACCHAHESFAKLLGRGHRNRVLAHLSWPVDQVVHTNDIWPAIIAVHGARFYAVNPVMR